MTIKTNFLKTVRRFTGAATDDSSADNGRFVTIEEELGEELGEFKSRFSRIKKKILAKVRMVGFVSLCDCLTGAELEDIMRRSEKRMKRWREKTSGLVRYVETTVVDSTTGLMRKGMRRIRNDYNYVTAETEHIWQQLDETARQRKMQRHSRRKSQGDADLDIVREFYRNPTPDAFAILCDRFRYGVHSYITKLVGGDKYKAEDLVQDTLSRVWEKRMMFDPVKSNFSTWLYTIARNITFTSLKTDGRERTVDADVNDMFSSTIYQATGGDTAVRTDDTYYLVDDRGDIETAGYDDVTRKMYDASVNEIKTMEPLFQQIIVMKNQSDMTLKEIARQLGVKESRVKNCYYKGRELLAESIREKYGDLYGVYRDATHDRDDQELMYG